MIASRWTSLPVLAAVAGIACGCSDSMPFAQLPDVTKLPQKVLSKDEQQGKVNEMVTRGQSHQSEAAKEIEKGK